MALEGGACSQIRGTSVQGLLVQDSEIVLGGGAGYRGTGVAAFALPSGRPVAHAESQR